MTKASIDCSRCGAASHVPVNSLLIDVAGPGAGDAAAGNVHWICQACQDVASQPVQWPTLLTLVAAGAPLLDPHHATRPPHPEAPADGPALTRDDILDFHMLLQRPTWFAELHTALGCPTGHRAG